MLVKQYSNKATHYLTPLPSPLKGERQFDYLVEGVVMICYCPNSASTEYNG